jgi:predicted Zn-dependent peptidase
MRLLASCALAAMMAAGSSGKPASAAATATSQVLPNGITLMTRQRPGSQVVAIDIAIRAGARYETAQTSSAARALESALLLGTEKYPSRDELLRAISGRGGALSVDAGREILEVSASVGLPDLDLALDVMSEILLRSRFDADDFERERDVIVSQLKEREDEPDENSSDVLYETVFAGHPLSHRPTGTIEGVEALSLDQLEGYWNSRLVGPNVTIGVVSGLSDAEVAARLGSALAAVPGGPVQALNYGDLPPAAAHAVTLDAGTDQAHVYVAAPLPGIATSDWAALRALNAILGRSSGRLFTEIRDKRGLAYSAYSIVPQFVDGGAFVVYAGTDPATADAVVDALKGELARIAATPPEAAEVQNAIDGEIGSRVVSVETSGSEVVTLTRDTVFGLPSRDIQTAQLRAVTPADVQRIARTYLDPSRLTVVVARPTASDHQP